MRGDGGDDMRTLFLEAFGLGMVFGADHHILVLPFAVLGLLQARARRRKQFHFGVGRH